MVDHGIWLDKERDEAGKGWLWESAGVSVVGVLVKVKAFSYEATWTSDLVIGKCNIVIKVLEAMLFLVR